MKIVSLNEGALDAVTAQIPELVRLLKLTPDEVTELETLFKAAYEEELMLQFRIDKKEVPMTYMAATPHARALTGFFMEKLITSWNVEGAENLYEALAFFEAGGNVIVMSNHTGVVDAPIAAYILLRFLSESYRMTWIAGKRVWESVLLRMFALCVDLLTMFGMKYVAPARGTKEFEEMRARNFAMLRFMRKNRSLWFAYPQGTWNNMGWLTKGEPNAMDLLGALGGAGYENTAVLPGYLSGPEKIIPPIPGQKKGKDGFHLFLRKPTPGHVDFRFGPMIYGRDLRGTKERGINIVMCAIADLARTQREMGPYALRYRKKMEL